MINSFTDHNLANSYIKSTFKNEKVVFTNGCFDIIHAGHVDYLSKAKNLGDRLVIGLNSDSSVKTIKGDSRPINNQTHRAIVLNALKPVDLVIIFNEDTPVELIKIIKPDVYVKGGDYKLDDLPEKPVVENYGGSVQLLSFVDGCSTSSIIEKIKKYDD